jgi:hypothetical protein
MKIPNKTLKVWQALKEHGDVKTLAELTGKSETTIWKIFRTGMGKADAVEKINEFYKSRTVNTAPIETDDNN